MPDDLALARYPPDGATVLDRVDLQLLAGATVALVGENGAGQTTVVKLLTGMYQPTAGQVLLDGVPLANIDLSAWRERVAATFQTSSGSSWRQARRSEWATCPASTRLPHWLKRCTGRTRPRSRGSCLTA